MVYDSLPPPTNAVKYATGKYLELIKAGVFASYEDNYTLCFQYYCAAVRSEPEHFYAYFHRGVEYFSLKQLDKSKQDFMTAIKYCNDASFSLVLEGLILEVDGKNDEALEKYVQAAQVDPANDFAWFSIGYIECSKERFQEAIKAYEKALTCYRFSPCIILNNIGWSYERLEDKEKAKETYTRSIETFPRCVKAHFNLGELYNTSFKDHDKAIELYKKILEIDPYNVFAMFDIGDVNHFDLKKFEVAQEWYEKANHVDNRKAHAYVMMANYRIVQYMKEGKKSKALVDKAFEILQQGLRNCTEEKDLERVYEFKTRIETKVLSMPEEKPFYHFKLENRHKAEMKKHIREHFLRGNQMTSSYKYLTMEHSSFSFCDLSIVCSNK